MTLAFLIGHFLTDEVSYIGRKTIQDNEGIIEIFRCQIRKFASAYLYIVTYTNIGQSCTCILSPKHGGKVK